MSRSDSSWVRTLFQNEHSGEIPALGYSRPRESWYRACRHGVCDFHQYEKEGAFPEISHVCKRDGEIQMITWTERPYQRGEFI